MIMSTLCDAQRSGVIVPISSMKYIINSFANKSKKKSKKGDEEEDRITATIAGVLILENKASPFMTLASRKLVSAELAYLCNEI
jgi:hypothetical protein